MQYAELPNLREVLPGIQSRADRLDQTGEWPEQDLRVLATLGACRWAVPLDHGGEELSPIELHFRYEAVASASVATALVLTQRDSAVSFIAAAEAWRPRSELLHKLANNELFATVGIAQLTTSRQRGAPALGAVRIDGGYRIDGEIPWATGAGHAAVVVSGAVLEDGRQILFVLRTDLSGVRVSPPMPLVALRGSHTAPILCDGVVIEDRQVLDGPVEQVLARRKKALPIGQAFIASGLCRGALDLIGLIDSDSARTVRARLAAELEHLRGQVLDYCNPIATPDPARGAVLRGQCIDLSLRAAHAAVSLHKGAALLVGHPAQRLAREAIFLLVWSCPSPVVDCTLDLLSAGTQR